MRIIFVRHGHPDYKNDCLTPLGHEQAKAAAARLQNEKVDAVYSSVKGRAMETASYQAKAHGKELILLDFMREIGWGSTDGEPIAHEGHPWFLADDMVVAGQSLLSDNWAEEPPFDRNRAVGFYNNIRENLDAWLSGLGYDREGEYYRVREANDQTIMLVSHGGSSSCVLSHLFNLPLPFVLKNIPANLTGITVVKMAGDVGSLISPKFEMVNDARHIQDVTDPTYDN